jgi:hypothetical protein
MESKFINCSSEKDFFKLIDLYTIGLEKTRELVEQDNYNEALIEYRKYFQNKLNSFKLELGSAGRDCTHEERIEKANNLLNNKLSLLNSRLIDIGDPIDWFLTPDDDIQWQSHICYMYFPNYLTYAYNQTGKSEYFDKWQSIIEDFIQNHPLGVKGLEYDPTNPMYKYEHRYKLGGDGRYPGSVCGSWIGLASASRVNQWIGNLKEVINSDRLSNVTLVNILTSLMTDHAHNLVNNPRRYTPNQFIHVSMSLTFLGIILSEFKIAPFCYLTGMYWLEEALDNFVLPDGSDPEQSFNYNKGLPNSFADIFYLYNSEPNKRVGNLIEKIKLRCLFLAQHITPLRTIPNLAKTGINDGIIPLLHIWYEVYHFAELKEILDVIESKEDIEQSVMKSIAFPYGGFYIMRNGMNKNDQYMFFKASRVAIGHTHEDCNSVYLIAYGREMLVDSGNFNYSSDDESIIINKYHTSSFAHNTISVDGMSQNCLKQQNNSTEELHKLREPINKRWYSSDTFDLAEGEYSAGYGEDCLNVKHERQVIYVKNKFWIVTDRIRATGNHKYTQSWQLAKEYTPEMLNIDSKSKYFNTTDKDGANISILNFSNNELHYNMKYGDIEPYAGWYAGGYNVKFKSIDVHTDWYGDGDQLIVSILYPFIDDSLKVNARDISEGNMVGFELVDTDGSKVTYIAALSNEMLKCDQITAYTEDILVIDNGVKKSGLVIGVDKTIKINDVVYNDCPNNFEFKIDYEGLDIRSFLKNRCSF